MNMKEDILAASRKEIMQLAKRIDADFNNDIEIYRKNNQNRKLAKHALATLLPLAHIFYCVYRALGEDGLHVWINQSLKGAHVDALNCEIGQEFLPTKSWQAELVKEYTAFAISQANYGEMLGFGSKAETERFTKAVEKNVHSFYEKNFVTFYSIKRTVDQYEPINDWMSASAIGVHMHAVHLTAEQFGLEVSVPVAVI
jgi:hypothetical protein